MCGWEEDVDDEDSCETVAEWDDDEGRVRGRRSVEVGGLGVTLKVVLWRRRWPWRDLGSKRGNVSIIHSHMGERKRPTLWVKLEDMDIAIGIDSHHGQVLAVGQEIGRQQRQRPAALAEHLERVRLLGVAGEPQALEGVGDQAQAGARQLARRRHVAAHVEKGHGQQRAVLLEAAHHALLALRHQHEALGANLGQGRDAAARNLLLGQQLEPLVRLGLARLGDDGDNVVDLHAAARGQILAPCQGRAHRQEHPALLCLFGDFEVQRLHALNRLARLHVDGMDDGPRNGIDQSERPPDCAGQKGQRLPRPLLVVVVILGQLKVLRNGAACNVRLGGMVVGNVADVVAQRDLLDRDAQLGQVRFARQLRDASHALGIRVDKPPVAAFGVKGAHAPHAEALQADDSWNALAALEDEGWRRAGKEDGAVAAHIRAGPQRNIARLLRSVVWGIFHNTLR